MSKTVILASDGISLSDTKTLEETVSSHSTSISNNATAIALKANSSDVYTKNETDGLISTEVSNRNSAIEQSASQIQLSVSETYSTKQELADQTKFTNFGSGNVVNINGTIKNCKINGASIQNGTPTPSDPVAIESITELTLHMKGKNLFNKTLITSGKYINSSGVIASGSSNSTTDFIDIISGEIYAFSYGAALSAGNYIAWYTEADETTVTGDRVDARGLTSIVATAPNNAKYVRFSFQTSALNSVQLECNSTATSYEPYIYNSIPISLQNNAIHNLPSNTKDVLSLTYLRSSERAGWAWYSKEIEQKVYELDLGDVTWSLNNSGKTAEKWQASGPYLRSNVGATNRMCSTYTVAASLGINASMTNNTIAPRAVDNVHTFYVKDNRYTSADTTPEEFKTAVTGVKFLYLMESSSYRTITLDPIELPIITQEMNVWVESSPSTDISVEWWTSVGNAEKEYFDLDSRLTTAESSITQNANNIELKVSKDGVISSINQSAEEIKIQASKVNIDGTAIFTNTDFQTQLNNQGYATTTQVATAKSEAISAAASDATSKANAAQSAAISTANSATDTKLQNYTTTTGMNTAIATAKQEAIDSIEVGGRNLLLSTPTSYNQNNYLTYQVPTTFALNELSVGDSITIQFWGVEVDDNYSGIGVYWNSGGLMLGSNTVKADANGYWKYTFEVTQQQLDNSASSGKKLFIYNMTNGHANSSLKIAKWKLEKGTIATDWTPAPEDVDASISAVDSSLESYKSTTNTTLTSLQNQVDGQIEAWYKSVDPTGSNEPASTWTTDALKARHMGDLYYNVTNGHSWRWMQSGNTYEWQQIPDSDAAAALAAAQDAQTTANSKRRIFTTTPTVPYDVGDLWVDGSSIKYCSNMKTNSGTYSENDWTTTATDDTGVSALQQQLTAQLGTAGAPYQEVEWIESNGKQFIYLDWKPVAETFGFEADFIIRNVFSTSAGAWNATTNINGFGNVFGVRNSSLNNDFQLGSYNTNGLIRLGNKDTYAYITRNTRQTCSLIGNVYTDPSGTERTITKGSTIANKPYHNMSVFAVYEGATRRATVGNLIQPGSVRIYSLKFYEDTTVAVNLTPAVRLSDNVAGLWDSISNHFYPARGAAVGEKITNHYFGEIYSIAKTLETTNPSLITTNTSASRLWTADAPMLDNLVDGQQITITPIYNSVATTRPEELSEWDESTTTAVGNVYIKLTLADNETTEWIPVYYSANARLTTHYVSGAPITLTYHENMLVNVADTGGSSVVRGWFQQPDYNTNTTYNLGQNIHATAITAKEAITRYHLIMGDALGYQNVAAGDTFDISYPLLLAYAAAIAATKTSTGTYETYPAADFSYNGTIEAGAANKMLYLKGTISGNTFTVAASPFMTTVIPDEADGYLYIPLGIMSSVKLANFVSSKDLYAYLDGEFRQVTPTEIVSTHRIYYRTATANLSLAAPTTWVEEATGNVYNQWTTKVPPLAASTASGQTKYLYLYTCEQRKRLDGTTVCTKVLLDENITVIDGGSIITNSVTANQIAANTITAAEIEAGTITATEIASNAITADKLNANAVTADKIAANAITTAKLDAGAVTAAKIDSGAITTDKLDANAVTAAKIASSAITTDKLDANAVTTAKLDAGAVTAAKIDSGAITTDKLDAGAVTAAKIASSAITTDKLDANAVTAAKIDATDLHVRAANIDGTIGFGQLTGVQASGNYALTTDIPTTVAQLTDSSNYALASNLITEINQRKAQYGTCSTAAGTTPKVVTCADFELIAGNEITVKFSTANTSSGKIQLNVNSKGNKDVWVGNAVTSATNMLLWGANAYITFKYDGTQFQVIGEPRTWYGECSVAEATAAKTSTITGCVICKGTKVELAMTYANSAASPTLNISSTGAKNLYFGTGTTRPTIAGGTSWLATNTATFTFDGATWRTQGKTYIDANSITTGYISADRIQGGSLSIGIFNNSTQADILNSNVTVPQKVSDLTNDTGFITSSSLPTKVSDLDNDSYFATQTEAQGYATTAANGKDSAIAAAARRTDVAIAVTAIDYDAGTATLQATLYIDGGITTNNITSYQWRKDGSPISGAISGTLSVTETMGLGHIYSCTIDYT